MGESSPENNNGMSVHYKKNTKSSGMRVHYKTKELWSECLKENKTNSSGMRVHYGKPKGNYGVSVHRGKVQWGESSPKKKEKEKEMV